MEKIKLEFILKTFAFLSTLIFIHAITTENFLEKFCFFFSISTTVLFTFDLELIYECKKIKEFLLWTIFMEISFLIFLMTLYMVKNVFPAKDEVCCVLAILIWVSIYRFLKSSTDYLRYAYNFTSQQIKLKYQSRFFKKHRYQ
jgi:hypothetical protein